MLLVFVLCAVVPVASLAVLSYRSAVADLEGEAQERLQDATKNLGMSMLEKFLFVLEELEFAEERLARGGGLEFVQQFPDRLIGIAHVRGESVLASVGDAFELSGLRPSDVDRLGSGKPAISFPNSPDSGTPQAVIWHPLGDGTVLAAAVEPGYGWGEGLLAILPVGTEVVVVTPDDRPLVSTLATGYSNSAVLMGETTGLATFETEIEGFDYYGGHWSLPLRHDFGHPGLVLIALTERSFALQRTAGFGRDYFLLGLTSLWVVLLLSIAQIRRNLEPLDDLTKATAQIGRRDFSVRVAVASDDELSQLADSFNVMSEEIGNLVEGMDELKQGALLALAGAVDAKSHWTQGHSERVTAISLRIARQMGLGEADLDIINRGGLLHDVGKIGVSSQILDKPARLTDAEFELMKQHPVIGAKILEPIPAYADVLPIVLQHHERVDGRGYPFGIGPEEFDFRARIVAVADVFDACTSDRPYRDGMPLGRVLTILREGSGTHFDPVAAEALETLVLEDEQFFAHLRKAAA
jgi:putative nucleotidyltransferase with HDIG domain